MTLPSRDHPEARREFLEAFIWYGSREHDLAERFSKEAQESLQLVCTWPDSAPPYRDIERDPPIRSKGMVGFPFRIVYLVHDGEVVVIAYAHESRRPGYWRSRFEDV